MTDCNYCKQSPQSLQPGCCTETRIFPAAERESADPDQAAQQGALAVGAARPREGWAAASPAPRAQRAAFTRCPCGARAEPPARGCGRGTGRDVQCPGAHTPGPACAGHKQAPTGHLGHGALTGEVERFQNLSPERYEAVGMILWTCSVGARHTQASCRDLQRSVLVLDDCTRSSQETALISVKILEGWLWHANSEQKG